jgi:hypothetical protein
MNHLESFCILLQRIINFLNNKKYIVYLFIVGTWKVKDIAYIIKRFYELVAKNGMKICFFTVLDFKRLERNMWKRLQHIV